jgi:hypothetical protein
MDEPNCTSTSTANGNTMATSKLDTKATDPSNPHAKPPSPPTSPITNHATTTPKPAYKILPQYHSKPPNLRVACIGAGASGLCLAYKMTKMLTPESWSLTLFEKTPHFGGTWYENTYPGVACDIPSHLYTFTFDPNPE